jgi:hypothetical protein
MSDFLFERKKVIVSFLLGCSSAGKKRTDCPARALFTHTLYGQSVHFFIASQGRPLVHCTMMTATAAAAASR